MRFIAKSSTVKHKTIAPLPTAAPSSFHKLCIWKGKTNKREALMKYRLLNQLAKRKLKKAQNRKNENLHWIIILWESSDFFIVVAAEANQDCGIIGKVIFNALLVVINFIHLSLCCLLYILTYSSGGVIFF